MKKFTLLSSLLALAACGGGGSGSGVMPGDVVKPGAYNDRVAASNSKITGMKTNSEAQIVNFVSHKLGQDASLVSLNQSGRGASVRAASASENVEYETVKELVELADWLAADSTSDSDIVEMFNKSASDKNKIKAALKLMDGMYCYVGGDADETARRILAKRTEHEFDAPLADIKEKTQVFDINTVDFDLAAGRFSDYGEKIKFSTDDSGRITNVSLSDNNIFENIDRNGDTKIFLFKNKPIYHYTIPIDGTEDGLFVEGVTSIGELKAKLKDKANEYYKNDADKIAEYEQIIDAITEKDVIAANGKEVLDATFEPEFGGKDVKLKYSDFGLMHITTNFHGSNPENISEAIAGGYLDKEIKSKNIQTAMHFTGNAIGSVQYRHRDNDDNEISKPAHMTLKGSATMDFNPESATQQVDLKFADWYDVSADTAGNIRFYNYSGNTGDKRFQFSSAKPEFSGAAVNYDKASIDGDTAGEVVLRYFGDNNTATESVGYVKVGEERLDTNSTGYESVLFNAGFGMKASENK